MPKINFFLLRGLATSGPVILWGYITTMTLRELRAFIAGTREREGVNWYLLDSTPVLGGSGLVFTLICYDDNGEVINQVPFIEERIGGKVPTETLLEIAAVRPRAGINAHFLAKAGKKGGSPLKIFEEARDRWISGAGDAFAGRN